MTPLLKLALFAGREVGFKVADFLARRGEPAESLVLDSADPDGWNRRILEVANVPSGRVFLSDELRSAAGRHRLSALAPDLGVLAWWPYILRSPLIALPARGFLNFHPSFLPFNRGKHYNFWALVEQAPFGVTLHHVDGDVDTGDIAYQRPIETTWEDTGRTLYEKAQKALLDLFMDKYPEIRSGRIPRVPQPQVGGSFHKGSELDPASEVHLDRAYTARQLLNLLRARTFPPHPACYFVDQGEMFEVRVDIRKCKGEARR